MFHCEQLGGTLIASKILTTDCATQPNSELAKELPKINCETKSQLKIPETTLRRNCRTSSIEKEVYRWILQQQKMVLLYLLLQLFASHSKLIQILGKE